MAWSTPQSGTAGAVITAAWSTANVVNPLNWLRALTGGADPPGSGYMVTSDSASTSTWKTGTAAISAVLGYTPLNKDGDTATGNLMMDYGKIFQLEGTGNTPFRLAEINASNQIIVGDGANASLRLMAASNTILADNQTIWHAGNDGAGSGLDADTLDGVQLSAINQVPSGLIAAFATAAELTSAGAGWARYTAADGRLLVGAGTTFGVTYTQDTSYGASWDVPAHTHSIGGVTDKALPNAGALTVTLGTSTVDTGSAAILLPSRAVVWGRKS